MGRKEDNIKRATEIMHDRDHIRNIAIAAHIDHGKTTLSDNLIAGAGMMSEDLAGKSRVLDFDEQESARGITINAASASMVHNVGGQDYLINLIDTPGHVDFGGDVTRARRAVDGCIILACAVEGTMPQTETVVRQALKEKVRPVLFINKVDRLINELQIDGPEMMARFEKIISKVNRLISTYATEDLGKEWQVSVQKGTVAFGSAYYNWGMSIPYMQKSNINFKQIFEYCHDDNQKELAKLAPVHTVLLDMTVEKHPSPVVAQKYRIPNIWQGDLESGVGKAMMDCDPDGPLSLMITKIWMDPHAGEVAVGRVYSGSIKHGESVWALGAAKAERVQQVSMMVGGDRIAVSEVSAGNIAALTGIKSAAAGVTITRNKDDTGFEPIRHYSEPVVTVAVEPKSMKDLPKFIDALRSLAKAGNNNLYAYRYDWDDHRRIIVADFKELIGAAHATEIPLLTGNNKLVGDYGFLIYPRGLSKRYLSKNMMKFWTNFAKYGEPGKSSNSIEWQPYNGSDLSKSSYMVLDNRSNLMMSSDNFSFKSLAEDLYKEPSVTELEKCVVLLQMLTFVGDDLYDDKSKYYPGDCKRENSEKFLILFGGFSNSISHSCLPFVSVFIKTGPTV